MLVHIIGHAGAAGCGGLRKAIWTRFAKVESKDSPAGLSILDLITCTLVFSLSTTNEFMECSKIRQDSWVRGVKFLLIVSERYSMLLEALRSSTHSRCVR
jgi:hypothetical protein